MRSTVIYPYYILAVTTFGFIQHAVKMAPFASVRIAKL
jgi:hypothetical protein